MEALYRNHMVLTRMLSDRGYNVQGDNNLTRQEFMIKYPDREALSNLIYNGPNDTIIVSYLIDTNKGGSIGVGPIGKMMKYMKQNNYDHGLIVIPEKLSSKAQEEIENARPDTRIEIFQESDLLFPIVDHRLVPRHVPLTDIQRQELIRRFELDPDNLPEQLPRLLSNEPVSIYYDFQPGEIIAIFRPTGLYYRIVV